MRSHELQAALGRTRSRWHGINWAACYRRIRSLQRRIVQAVQAGAWRKVKRLTYLLVHSFAARAIAVKRVTEKTGKKTPGIDGEVWNTPDQKAQAIERIGQWQGYRPLPLRRLYIPKKNGRQRPLSIPAMADRARQAVYLQALQPVAETTADPNSYGFRPKRRCADAIDQCFKVLRQQTSASWILEGDIEGFFDNISFSWLETHIPMNKRVLGSWLRSGYSERGQLFPTTSGVPQGGLCSPVISNLVLDGLEAVVHGSPGQRRKHHLHYIRWADDFIVTASSREVLEQTVRPRIETFLTERGVRLSPTKTRITPLTAGVDFLGQTIRKFARSHGKPAKLQITPSTASLQAVKAKIKALCHHARTPTELIDTLNPVLRGWANYHRHVICGSTFARLDSFVWYRTYRWAKRRHANKTGRWITDHYFPHQPGEAWRFTDPRTGRQLLRVHLTIKPQRHLKVRATANPFDPAWAAYFEHRDRQMTQQAASPFRATILRQQQGLCPGCRQGIQEEDALDLHHRDGNHLNTHLSNLLFLHPNCHRQHHYAPDTETVSSRSRGNVAHA